MLLFIAVPAHVRTDQLEVSIHLMLLFIKRVRIHIHALDWVSIHLMLLFILDTQLRGPQGPWFQYISCYSLSAWWKRKLLEFGVSIHLMLLFIAMDKYGISLTDSFQYISCYSLSLAEWIDYVNAIKFQYISCYSLSLFKVGQIVKCRLFQYISCYSLSCLSDIDFYRAILFQYISCYSLSNLCYKSGPFLHVSIHLMLLFIINHQKKKLWNLLVSIHLMLLFILCGHAEANFGTEFQYISCYSLSEWL